MIRAPWSSGSSEEESRVYLQTRLTVLYKLMFWAFVVLILVLVFRPTGLVAEAQSERA